MMNESKRYQACSRAAVDAWIAEEKIPPQFQNARFPYHLISLFLNNKPLLNAYAAIGRYIGGDLTISPRDRELIIIRCAVKLQSIYEWDHHKLIAKTAGLSDQDLEELKLPAPRDLSAVDMALVKGCDEMIAKIELSDETFRMLSEHFDVAKILEIISVVALYQWTAMLLRSFHVSIEEVFR